MQPCLKRETLLPDGSLIILIVKGSRGIELAFENMGNLPVSIREGHFTTLADVDKTQGIGRFKEGLWAGESKCFQAVTKD